MRDADVIVVNGVGFEEGLLDTIDAAEATARSSSPPLDGRPRPTSTATSWTRRPPPTTTGTTTGRPALLRRPGPHGGRRRAPRRRAAHARARPRHADAFTRAGGRLPRRALAGLDAEVDASCSPSSPPSGGCWSPTTRCSATSPTATASRCSARSSPAAPPWPSPARRPRRPGRRDRGGRRAGHLRRDLLAVPPGRRAGRRGGRRRGGRALHRVPGRGRHRGDTYLDMVRTNAERIADALGADLAGWRRALAHRPVRARVHAARPAGRDAGGGGRRRSSAPGWCCGGSASWAMPWPTA